MRHARDVLGVRPLARRNLLLVEVEPVPERVRGDLVERDRLADERRIGVAERGERVAAPAEDLDLALRLEQDDVLARTLPPR